MKCGLEIHVQLKTDSKLFCDCPTSYREVPANSNICPFCLSQPGAKPLPTNEKALENVLTIVLMLNCEVNRNIIYFMRKHYDYPDLPSGYQRTSVPIGYEGDLNGVGIREIHIEEDPGQFKPDLGIVDFNRSGIPLVEIVTEPDMHSPEEVRIFLKELIRVLKYSKCARGEGTMRVDVNISLEGGNRVEIKNINSIKGAYKALKFEMLRQKNLMKREVEIKQETRAFLESQMITVTMRTKKDTDEYRIMLDLDLPPFKVQKNQLKELIEAMPEAPHNKVKRFIKQYKIDEETAKTLTSDLELANTYEEVSNFVDPKFAAMWMRDELKRVLTYNKLDFADSRITAENIVELLNLLQNNEITSQAGKRIIEKMPKNNKSSKKIAEDEGLIGVIKDDKVINAAKKAIDNNPIAVQDYKEGKNASINFLVGQIMKTTRGKADPEETLKTLKDLLDNYG